MEIFILFGLIIGGPSQVVHFPNIDPYILCKE